ncbi:MAG TPA: XdhC/CoxI family protein [Pyrinomonadaceae bacterium]|nr:XdhC/CoxI family protein [Pyrinomonadaceae bacterium]
MKSTDQSEINGKQITALLESGASGVLITVLASDARRVGAKMLIQNENEIVGDLGDSQLNDAVLQQAGKFLTTRDEARANRVGDFAPELKHLADSLILFERIEAEPRLVIAGAGHVGASLARLAATVGYRVSLIDDRAEFVTRELFSSPVEQSINLVPAADWSDAVREAIGYGRGVSVAIVTRGHKQDEECLRAAAVANPDYIGMIGSKRRTNIVLDKLREEGIPDEQLKRVHAPIGLDISAVSPEEVALAILAEIVAERRGGSGGSLSAWRR